MQVLYRRDNNVYNRENTTTICNQLINKNFVNLNVRLDNNEVANRFTSILHIHFWHHIIYRLYRKCNGKASIILWNSCNL